MKLTLSHVDIINFKAIHLNGHVPLQPFTIIVGRNGTGKSSVLEALQMAATACRQDVHAAFDKFQGISEVINKKAAQTKQYVEVKATWGTAEKPADHADKPADVEWTLRIGKAAEDSLPFVLFEELSAAGKYVIKTRKSGLATKGEGARRVVLPDDPRRSKDVDSSDTLAVAESVRHSASHANGGLEALHAVREFWRNAVFVRLSPASLAAGSPPKRKSFDPILTEDGSSLPQLLADLGEPGREQVALKVQRCLKDVVAVKVSKAKGSHDLIHFSLTERMAPYGGRKTRDFDVPAWLLSEGTRRLTALFALMARETPPSLLMVEEVENGLDPWSTVELLRHLKEAAHRTQVILTTHSPWLLNHVAPKNVLVASRSKGNTTYGPLAAGASKTVFGGLPAGVAYVESGGGTEP